MKKRIFKSDERMGVKVMKEKVMKTKGDTERQFGSWEPSWMAITLSILLSLPAKKKNGLTLVDQRSLYHSHSCNRICLSFVL